MKLYYLELREDLRSWDCNHSFVIRAENEDDARFYASQRQGDENNWGENVWLNKEKTTCTELFYEGKAGIIIADFKSG